MIVIEELSQNFVHLAMATMLALSRDEMNFLLCRLEEIRKLQHNRKNTQKWEMKNNCICRSSHIREREGGTHKSMVVVVGHLWQERLENSPTHAE